MSKKREHENEGHTESKGKKKLKSDNISNLDQKRGWESWSREEMENFFSCFAQSGKDFDKITGSVGTKNYDQVRYFYYRVLNKVVKLLKPQKIDKKDPREVQQALLAFWDLKKTLKEKEEEYTKSFASQLRSKFTEKSQQENFDKPVVAEDSLSLEDSPSFFKSNPLLNDVEAIQETQESPKLSQKLTIQLMPRTKRITDVMIKAKQNPRLQLTLKGGKTIAFILEYLHNKWTTTIDGKQLCLANGPIKLYPSQESMQSTFSTQFTGWGEDEGQTSILQLYQLLSENPHEVLKLEYDWQSSTSGQLDSSGFTKHSLQPTTFSNLEAANVNLDNHEIPQAPSTSANPHSNHLSRTVTTPTKKTISENSSMWADDLSTDGFGATLNDTDEKACKDFYKIFENSIQEGFDATENGKGSHSSPSVSGFTWKKVLKLE